MSSLASESSDVLMSLSGNLDLEPHMEEIMSCAKGKHDAGTPSFEKRLPWRKNRRKAAFVKICPPMCSLS